MTLVTINGTTYCITTNITNCTMINTPFVPFPKITGSNISLRSLSLDDLKSIYELRSDEFVIKYINRKAYKDLSEASDFIMKIKEDIANGEAIFWVITELESTQLIGSICLWNFDYKNQVGEVGFELLPAYHNQGIMTEALEMVLNFGFLRMNFKRIDAFTHFANAASIRLLKKFHFKQNLIRKDDKVSTNIVFELRNP